MKRLIEIVAKDSSLFGHLIRRSIAGLPILSRSITLDQRLMLGAFPRIYYAYCVTRAAKLAASLGYKEVSILEFGVAGGNGLLVLEEIKAIVEEHMSINIRLFGFDIGSGLPTPLDYRDLPYHWQGGFYEMDVKLLKSKLKTAQLVLGPITETVPEFILRPNLDSPIGMISFDLDYYSSTVDAFKIFDVDRGAILPRVMCYFDDIVGINEYYSDFTGERFAISEFNQQSHSMKISPCYDFAQFAIERWQQRVMVYHDFAHPRYNTYVGNPTSGGQLPLAR